MRTPQKTRKKKYSSLSPCNIPYIPPNDRDIVATISLSAIQHNLNELTKKSGTEIMPILKSNAYGHGIYEMAKQLRHMGVEYLGVATLGEAILLRNHGDKGRIISWLYNIHGQEIKDAISLDLDITLFDETHLPLLQRMIPKGKKVRLTVFVDTGIQRAGIPYDKALDICRTVAETPCFSFVGIMSHLVCSDRPHHPIIHKQLRLFRSLRDTLRQEGIEPPMVHIANTDACLQYDVSDFTISRAGCGIIGISRCSYPRLQLAMELTTRIIQIKEIQKGDGVGYGWTFRAPRRMKIAILPIGYGDGIPFSTFYVYCNGSRRKILGDISMDQMVIESKKDNMNDIVCLFGNGSSCPQTIYDIEQQSGSTHVEILSHLGHRIRRIYIH